MDSHDDGALALLVAIADVDSAFSDLARRLRERGDVKDVLRSFHVDARPGFDFYTDAELTTGEAVSWGLEAAFVEGEWVIESAIRRNHSHGQDSIRDFPTRFALGTIDLVSELRETSKMLLATWPDDQPMFQGLGYG